MIFMNFINNDESVKIRLEMNIGVYVFDELLDIYEFDIIDCYDICKEFLPPNYIISRENYLFSSF